MRGPSEITLYDMKRSEIQTGDTHNPLTVPRSMYHRVDIEGLELHRSYSASTCGFHFSFHQETQNYPTSGIV